MRLFRSSVARAALLGVSFALVTPAVPLIQPAAARSAPDSFADLAAKLLPAVVNVSSTQTLTAKNGGGGPDLGPDMPVFPPGSPFEQFFKDFLNRNRPGQGGGDQPAPRRAQSLGSGFIIDPAGYVVTNNHVIEGADSVSVTLQDGTSLKAEIVGRDESGDLALLKVKADKPLPTVEFGDSSQSRVGDWVLAIGNPFGLGGTVTAGIVSARGRDIHQGQYDDFIQTDAAINRGNSGGPLFNMDGQVIGINTAIFSPSGGSIGIGFSIPSNMAKNIVAQLKQYGHPRRGWLGVKIQQVTPEIAESLGLKDANGAMVAGVTDGGPAEKAKIRGGDIILKFNGQDVKEMHNLPRIVADSEVGKEVPVELWRDGKDITVQTTLAERPADAELASTDTGNKPVDTTKPTDITGLGMKVAPVSQELKDKFQLGADQKGVVITDVAPNTPAADRGLKPGDVIMEVQQTEVAAPADIQKQVDAAKKADRKNVLMLIQREGGVQYVPLSLSKASDSKDKQPG
ncbi:MAG TPA: DegQ family serine endoprotease [Rhodopila sp.]